MSAVCKLAIFCLALLSAGAMVELPDASATATGAGARGLQRLEVEGLKKAFIGKHVERDARGKTYRVEYGEDGSVVLSDTAGEIDRGTFSITRQNGGGMCLRLEQQMNQRFFAIWFENADGFLFGYQTGDGTLRAVARPDTR